MPNIPAICINPKCLTVFPSGFSVQGAAGNVEFINCTASSCPKCGSVGRIPNGRYDIFGDSIFAVLSDIADVSLINKAIAVIKKNIKENKSPDEIVEKARTEVPELQTLWDFIPKTRVEAYAFITLLILFLTKFIDYYPSLKSPAANTTVIQQQIVNQSFQQFYSHASGKASSQQISHNKKKKKQQRKIKKETQRKSRRK